MSTTAGTAPRPRGGLVVFKYGGAGLSTGKRITEAVQAVMAYPADQRIMVVSAPGTTTDTLYDLTAGTTVPLRDQDLANVWGLGERISARLVTAVARGLGHCALTLEPEDPRWPVETTGGSVGARVDYPATAARALDTLPPLLESGTLIVVCGFLGTEEGLVTTLRRGGSDETAVVLGRALRAREVLLVKEVAGVYEKDPRVDPGARFLPEVTPEFLLGVAHRGGRIVSASALEHWIPELTVRIVPSGPLLASSGGTHIVPAPTSRASHATPVEESQPPSPIVTVS